MNPSASIDRRTEQCLQPAPPSAFQSETREDVARPGLTQQRLEGHHTWAIRTRHRHNEVVAFLLHRQKSQTRTPGQMRVKQRIAWSLAGFERVVNQWVWGPPQLSSHPSRC